MQHRKLRTLSSPRLFKVLTAALCLSTVLGGKEAKAADLIWNDVVAQGSGDGVPCRYKTKNPARNNVFWSAAGGDLSLILTNWGISFPNWPASLVANSPHRRSAISQQPLRFHKATTSKRSLKPWLSVCRRIA